MFDVRTFSLAEMFSCSAELRALGEDSSDGDDAAKRVVSYLFEQLQHSNTGGPECVLVRLFRAQALSALDEKDAAIVARVLGPDADPETPCLSLRATRGVKREWNDPALSRKHGLIPIQSMSSSSEMPMVTRLVSELGLLTPSSKPLTTPDERDPFFNVFHVEEARGSPLVPDQSDFVEPYGVESVLGFGGAVPPSRMFAVVLFTNIAIPKATADLFRALAPSVGLALLSPERDLVSLKACVRSYKLIVRHHEEVALRHHQQLRQFAEELTTSLAERQRFEALVENSSDFIGISKPDGAGIYLNPAARRLVGLSREFDVTKTNLADYYVPEARAQILEQLIPMTLTEGQWACETSLRNWKTGALIPVSNRSFTIRETQTGRLLGMGVVLRDISKKRADDEERERLLASAESARAAEQAASRAKDDFLASLGHELRNPLSPILTSVELMKLRGEQSREREIIERQAVHLARLVDDLLDVARIARGKLEVQRKPVEIAGVVRRAVEIVSPMFDRREQRIVVDVPSEGLIVNADTGRLAQVVSNLLDNASKYSAPGSEVLLHAERVGEHLRIRVRDHGIGVAPEVLDTIFDAFVQHRRCEARSPGLGLGLAIVRNLVALHDGTVHVHSKGPGMGSEFVVELPLIVTASISAPENDARTNPLLGDEHVKRVLVVDDNEDAARVLREALKELGHEVMVATDGPSALELVEDFKPEVALLDIGLPGMDGYELARRLRRLPGMPAGLRLVAVSGFGQKDDRQRSLEAGFADHLIKPVRLEALMNAVRCAA